MAETRRLAAIDLGAESGRVVVGRFDGDAVELDVAHRFPNVPVRLPDGLHWNAPGLFAEIVDGLGAAAAAGRLDGVGIDAWGCDYALLDGGGRMLGLPFHYRDERTSSEASPGRTRASRARSCTDAPGSRRCRSTRSSSSGARPRVPPPRWPSGSR